MLCFMMKLTSLPVHDRHLLVITAPLRVTKKGMFLLYLIRLLSKIILSDGRLPFLSGLFDYFEVFLRKAKGAVTLLLSSSMLSCCPSPYFVFSESFQVILKCRQYRGCTSKPESFIVYYKSKCIRQINHAIESFSKLYHGCINFIQSNFGSSV